MPSLRFGLDGTTWGGDRGPGDSRVAAGGDRLGFVQQYLAGDPPDPVHWPRRSSRPSRAARREQNELRLPDHHETHGWVGMLSFEGWPTTSVRRACLERGGWRAAYAASSRLQALAPVTRKVAEAHPTVGHGVQPVTRQHAGPGGLRCGSSSRIPTALPEIICMKRADRTPVIMEGHTARPAIALEAHRFAMGCTSTSAIAERRELGLSVVGRFHQDHQRWTQHHDPTNEEQTSHQRDEATGDQPPRRSHRARLHRTGDNPRGGLHQWRE